MSEPARVTEADIRQVGAAGVTEDVIFELVVCAAVGTADRQYRAGLAALAEVLGDGGGAADEA